MLKRGILAAAAFCILFSLCVVKAADEPEKPDFEKRVSILKIFDIIDEDTIISENLPVSRGDLLNMICHFFDVEFATDGEKLGFAAGQRIISDAAAFDPERDVTYEEAVKMLVSAVGFNSYAGTIGGYPTGFLKIAKDIGLTKGITTDAADGAAITELLYNAMSVDVAKPYIYNNGVMTYEVIRDTGALSLWRDIVKIEGVVTGTDVTSFNGDDTLRRGDIAIDGEIYTLTCEYPEQIIGMPVMAWVYEEDKAREIRYFEIKERKVTTMEIKDRDIDGIGEGFSYIEYYDGNREKKAKLSSIVKVIYNGVLYTDYTEEDLMPATGSLKLADTDDDGRYDIIYVESFEIILVDSVSMYNSSVSNLFRHESAINFLELDPESSDYRFKLLRDGEECELTSIQRYDVLNIARSKNGFNIKAVVSPPSVQGRIISAGGPDKTSSVIIDNIETVIDVSDVYYLEAERNTAGLDKIEFGTMQNLYLDIRGRIVAVRDAKEKDERYVWAVKCVSDEGPAGTEIIVKYLNDEDEWVKTKLAEKVKVNGERKTAEKAGSVLGAGEYFTNQLLRIKTDDDGLITDIETATRSDTYISDKFTASGQYTMIYRSPALYSSGYKDIFYPSSGSTVFIVPPAGEPFDERNYIVMTGYFEYNQSYRVRAYDADEFLCSDVFVVESDADRQPYSATGKQCIITSLGMKVTTDKETLPYIRGDLGNYKNIELTVSDNNTGTDISELGKGDFIRFDIDREGRVVNIRKYVDCSDGAVREEEAFLGGSEERRINKGIVEKINTDKSMIILDFGSNKLPFKIPSDCYIYDKPSNTITKATVKDIKEGDYVAILRAAFNMTTTTAIIYRY